MAVYLVCNRLQFPADEQTVLVLLERVTEAQRIASKDIREMQSMSGGTKKKRGRGDGNGDDRDAGEDEGGVDAVIKGAMKGKGGGGKRHKKKH